MTARCMRVREAHTLARSPHFPNLDRIYVSGSIAAVVDGATPKTTQASAGTEPFLDIVMGCLDALTCTPSSAVEFLADLWSKSRSLIDDAAPASAMPSATIAVIAAARGEVWRIGDPWVVIDGEPLAPRAEREAVVARERSARTHSLLAAGATIDDLRANDRARESLAEDLRALSGWRNSPCGTGFGALDPLPPAERYVEVWGIPDGPCRIVLATDGYLGGHASLPEAEDDLAARIQRDPLMIEDPPATKGVQMDARSFDDRSFISVDMT